jgi:hypothetical protein
MPHTADGSSPPSYAKVSHLVPFIRCALYPLFVVLLNRSLESLWVCANDLTYPLSILIKQECWHGSDAELLCYVWDIVDIELVEPGVCEFVGESIMD